MPGTAQLGVLISLLLLAQGCGYSSSYTPRADGRARPVWRDHRLAMHIPGIAVGDACRQAIKEQLNQPPPSAAGPYEPRFFFNYQSRAFYWVKLPPSAGQSSNEKLWSPPLQQAYFAAHLALSPASEGSFTLGSSPSEGWYSLLKQSGLLWILGRAFDRGMINRDGKHTYNLLTWWLALSDLLLVGAPWFPPLALTSAWQQPGFWHGAAAGIDEANAFNDLARRPGNPCSYEGTGESP